MKRFLTLVLVLLLLLSMPIGTYAASVDQNIVDNAGLFTDEELLSLDTTAQKLSQIYGIEVLIVTEDGLGNESAQDYAESLYTYDARGWWDAEHAILFLLDMDRREWFISTGGDAIYAFTDYGLEQLGELTVGYLSAGDYYGGFEAYLSELPEYLEAYAAGSPIDGYFPQDSDNYPVYPEETVYYQEEDEVSILLSLLTGIVVAAIAVLVMRGSMNSKRRQGSAADYVKSGSYQLHTHKDMFLYSQISKVRRQQSSNGGHGGGSSIHRSSGGRSHGGRGGRF